MPHTTTSPKDAVQALERRTHDLLDAPPTRDDIRRQLGWDLLPHLRQPDCADRD